MRDNIRVAQRKFYKNTIYNTPTQVRSIIKKKTNEKNRIVEGGPIQKENL